MKKSVPYKRPDESMNSRSEGHQFILPNISFESLTAVTIAAYTEGGFLDDAAVRNVYPEHLETDNGIFTSKATTPSFPKVIVILKEGQIAVFCSCYAPPGKLCEHEAVVLNAIIKKDEFRIFYDKNLRHQRLKKFAADYGLENEPDIDSFFQITYQLNKLLIAPLSSALMPVTGESLVALQNILVPAKPAFVQKTDSEGKTICILRQHKYYQYLYIELYAAQTGKEGKIKNPLSQVHPLDRLWETDDAAQLKFFTAVNKFQTHLNGKKTDEDITALKAIIKNPLSYEFYYHNSDVSEKITAASITPVKIKLLPNDLILNVGRNDQFYELQGSIKIDGQDFLLNDVSLKYSYFVAAGENLYLASSLQVLNVIEFLKKKPDNILIHTSKIKEFKNNFLEKLEDKINIKYQEIKPATPAQLQQQGFNTDAEKIIYLSDFGAHVMIIPVMRYGEIEISIRTKKQIYSADKKGNQFLVQRHDDEEIAFTDLLISQHPYFAEQMQDDLDHFYLHKKRFLDEDWFLGAFDTWQQNNITVFGFNELEGNKLRPEKVNITIKVLSGINWFNSDINVRYGRKKAALKQIYRAVKNKSRYVHLDDGTIGILPLEWVEKFTNYFNSGEITGDHTLRTAKTNFSIIEKFYEQEQLEEAVKKEINQYRGRLENFDNIQEIEVPPGLNGKLRHYQQTGLNWLNFLDDFNFGGCLADDMGLGKSVQIIAFILSQKAKVSHNTNLIVVPTSLIFNWQQEVAKFAPTLSIYTLYGAGRIKSVDDFSRYEIIITSYGSLLSDINFLKEYAFNYVFLDESQNIKNPGSQRYKAACLLRSRNRIVITGTPVENNTFDIYGQLSFACPGLLGSKQYFKDIYSAPIDKFKNSKRAAELQNKIRPFILRRTKQQVAAELPEKTEMILYCEMQPEQRGIYDAYEKEFREYISATTGEMLKKSPMNVLKGITRLRQICNSPLLIKGEKMPGNTSAKINILIEQIAANIPGHKILVFSQFVAMLDLIKKELTARNMAFAYLTGQTKNREAVVTEFQNNPHTRVFLISLKAGGTGLNLTEADYVYLVDPWWNPAVENQAIDRCHRIGQNKKIVAVRLICPDTIEEKIMQLQQHKKDLASDLITTDNAFLSTLSRNDLLNLVS